MLKNVKRKWAQKLLSQATQTLEKLSLKPVRTLAQTLTSWLEAIVAMWQLSKSNRITEGFHTRQEKISHSAFGFRNFENERLSGLALRRWKRIINKI